MKVFCSWHLLIHQIPRRRLEINDEMSTATNSNRTNSQRLANRSLGVLGRPDGRALLIALLPARAKPTVIEIVRMARTASPGTQLRLPWAKHTPTHSTLQKFRCYEIGTFVTGSGGLHDDVSYGPWPGRDARRYENPKSL